jgi:environmental stress-induced protein Ves
VAQGWFSTAAFAPTPFSLSMAQLRIAELCPLAFAANLQYKCSIRGGPMARFTIDTDPQFDQNMNDLVNMTGGTKADVIRKALATYKYLKTENQQRQNKVSITNKDNVVLNDVILP